MEDGYHTPLEEYLETIQTLSDEGTAVIGARVAERLGRSAPAVKEMLDRLEEDGYLERSGRVITLTERGETVATTVVRRHRLAERLLCDVIGLEWHKVHAEAGRWEHVISPDVEERLVALLGDPATCPHGNPIPGSRHARERAERGFEHVDVGERVTLVRIGEAVEQDHEVLVALDRSGFIPGRSAVVVAHDDEGNVVLSADGGLLELSVEQVAALYLAPAEKGDLVTAP